MLAARLYFPENNREENSEQTHPESSTLGKEVEMEATHNESDEGDFSSPKETDCPFTILSEIRRLGPLSVPRFIIANRKWLEKLGLDPSHLSLAMRMSSYSFVVPNGKTIILSVHKGQFAIYKLALDAGLRFPLHDFIE